MRLTPEGRREALPCQPLLLVLNKHEDTLAYVDPDRLEVLAKIPAGRDPHEIVTRADGRFAYVSNYAPPGNTVSVLDLVTRRRFPPIPTGEHARVHGAAVSPDGWWGYFTATQAAEVIEVDLRTRALTRTIPTGGSVSHMVAVSPDGRFLYTANLGTQDVSVLERASGDLVSRVPCGRGGEGLTFAPDGRSLWVANQEAASITVISFPEHEVARTIPCPGVPLRIRFTADGRLALVSSWEERGALVVLEADTGTEMKRLPLGNQPIGVEISPDGRRAFVTNMSSDEVHTIDMTSLEVAGVFHTGRGPDGMAWWPGPAREE